MSTRFTVLVVDSDDAFQAELEATLKVEGFRVIKAGTFAEGRRLLDAHSSDAAVIDLRLPDGSGLELVKEAGSRSEAPVLVSTAEYPDTREVVEAILRGGRVAPGSRPHEPVEAVGVRTRFDAGLRRFLHRFFGGSRFFRCLLFLRHPAVDRRLSAEIFLLENLAYLLLCRNGIRYGRP